LLPPDVFAAGKCAKMRWRSPDPLAGLRGPTSKERGGEEGRERRGGEGR